MKSWLVYLLRCGDGSLYCGSTNNLDARIRRHNQGMGAKYTRGRLPVTLAAASGPLSRSLALKLEYRIKQLPAGKKIEALLGEKQ